MALCLAVLLVRLMEESVEMNDDVDDGDDGVDAEEDCDEEWGESNIGNDDNKGSLSFNVLSQSIKSSISSRLIIFLLSSSGCLTIKF